MTLIVWPIILYMCFFYIHLEVLNHSGNGDGFYSSAFQSQLIGNSLHNATMPRQVAYGAVLTLKNHKTGGGYLHSHYHLYPKGVGARQQQVIHCVHSYIVCSIVWQQFLCLMWSNATTKSKTKEKGKRSICLSLSAVKNLNFLRTRTPVEIHPNSISDKLLLSFYYANEALKCETSFVICTPIHTRVSLHHKRLTGMKSHVDCFSLGKRLRKKQ